MLWQLINAAPAEVRITGQPDMRGGWLCAGHQAHRHARHWRERCGGTTTTTLPGPCSALGSRWVLRPCSRAPLTHGACAPALRSGCALAGAEGAAGGRRVPAHLWLRHPRRLPGRAPGRPGPGLHAGVVLCSSCSPAGLHCCCALPWLRTKLEAHADAWSGQGKMPSCAHSTRTCGRWRWCPSCWAWTRSWARSCSRSIRPATS